MKEAKLKIMKRQNNSVFIFNTNPIIRFLPKQISWDKASFANKLRALLVPFLRSFQKKRAFIALKKQINKSNLAELTSLTRPGKLD